MLVTSPTEEKKAGLWYAALQGLLPAKNGPKGLELSPAETPSVPALALGVRIVTGTQ